MNAECLVGTNCVEEHRNTLIGKDLQDHRLQPLTDHLVSLTRVLTAMSSCSLDFTSNCNSVLCGFTDHHFQ